MVGIGGEIASPVESTVIIPNRKDILTARGQLLYLVSSYLSHECHEILSRIAVYCNYSIALLLTELLHSGLYDLVGVVIEFLEIMTKVAEYVTAFQDSL